MSLFTSCSVKPMELITYLLGFVLFSQHHTVWLWNDVKLERLSAVCFPCAVSLSNKNNQLELFGNYLTSLFWCNENMLLQPDKQRCISWWSDHQLLLQGVEYVNNWFLCQPGWFCILLSPISKKRVIVDLICFFCICFDDSLFHYLRLAVTLLWKSK